MKPAVTTDAPQHGSNTTSVEKAAEGQGQDGTGDHRILLRGASISASPAAVHQSCQPDAVLPFDARSGQ
jgi:hypothetical protein